MVSKLTITRPKLGRLILSQATTTQDSRQIFSAETFGVLMKPIPLSRVHFSIAPATFSNIQPPKDRATIVSGLPSPVLAERLACEPHRHLALMPSLPLPFP